MKGQILEEFDREERRYFPRFKDAQPVRFQFKDPSRFGGCLSCDLSEGGIRVHLNEFIPLHTELILQIQLVDKTVVECPCRVAWVTKSRFGDSYQAGLEFTEEDDMLVSRSKIRDYLAYH